MEGRGVPGTPLPGSANGYHMVLDKFNLIGTELICSRKSNFFKFHLLLFQHVLQRLEVILTVRR